MFSCISLFHLWLEKYLSFVYHTGMAGKLSVKIKGFMSNAVRLYSIDKTRDIESQRKKVLLHIVFTLVFIFLPPYMFIVFAQKEFLTALLDLAALLLMAATALYLHRTDDFDTAGYLVSIVMGGFFLYLIAAGGIENTGPIWTFPLPLVLLFLLGLRRGTFATSVFMTLMAIIFFYPGKPFLMTQYPDQFDIRFFTSFFAVASLAFFSESVRTRITENITAKTKELEQTLTALSSAEKERSLLQEELLSAKKLEAIGTMAGGMAHEFNNQVSVIMGNLDMLQRLLEEDPAALKKIAAIQGASEHIAVLTDQMLSFSRKQILRKESLNINQLISRTEYSIHRLAGERVDVNIDLEQDLKNIEADSGQIIQVIMDLVTNAMDAMQKSPMRILSISTGNRNNPEPSVLLRIKDSGAGMDKETQQKIFEPFFTTKPPGKGIGLGLSFVYGTIKQHNGSIDIQSSPGQGTTVDIYLPVEKKL